MVIRYHDARTPATGTRGFPPALILRQRGKGAVNLDIS